MKYINLNESKQGVVVLHTDKEGKILRVDVVSKCKNILMQLGYKGDKKSVISLCESFTPPSPETLYAHTKLKTFALMIFLSYDEVTKAVLDQGFYLKQ